MSQVAGWIKSLIRAYGILLCLAAFWCTQNAQAKIVINEFMAVNRTTTHTVDGEYADWIELHNTSPAPADIGGYYLTDNFSTPTKWRIPNGTVIGGLGHIVIWANDTDPPNPARPLYASFRLGGQNGEEIGLYLPDGVTTESFIRFGHQAADVSYGRVLDDFPNTVPFLNATPGRPNGGYQPPPASLQGVIFINEWMARNRHFIKDNRGERDDWAELYNAGDIPIDLGGYFLTDAATTPTKWMIPFGNVVGPHDFILFWVDDDEEQGLNHTSFNLSGSGEQIGIYEKDGLTPIDLISFGPQFPDISQGRWPDGAAMFRSFSHPTPWDSNVASSTWARRWRLYR